MSAPHSYTMSRVPVSFPHKAYPSQVAMMNQIIKSLQRGQNALLESPTGSGKSLALLCAALAWQKDETKKAREYNMAVEQGIIEPEFEIGEGEEEEEVTAEQAAINLALKDSLKENKEQQGGFIPEMVDDLDDFQDGKEPAAKRPCLDPAVLNVNNKAEVMSNKKIKKKTVPKIYFGTRTHKQITQIIRELNKTAYKDVRMSILGSRDHTCIHPVVSKMKSRNEGCKELTDRKKGGGCSYMQAVKSKLNSHSALNAYKGNRDAWDLEDLVKVGKKVRACPYYATRELKNKAEIIFCPYNYLVEPMIRKSMDINVKGQIFILDEAHNIEDSARSAAGWQVTQDDLREAMKDLEKLVAAEVEVESHRELARLCSQLSTWIDSCSDDLNDYSDFGSSSKVWTGTEIVAVFNVHGIGHERYEDLRYHLETVVTEWQANNEEDESGLSGPEKPALNSNTISVLEGYMMVMGYLYMEGMKHRDDYRVALTRAQVRKTAADEKTKPMFGSWLSAKNKKGQNQGQNQVQFKMVHTVNFWCLNPAVSFVDLKESLHSIILTSGTLSPMTSFSTELDVKFSLQLEANHVIDKRQVWISTLSHGPTGGSLNATYRNAETFAFQDEIGRATAAMCGSVPHGVLLFLPSYSMLNKLSERWKMTGLWEQLCHKKVVISEPRFSDEFEASIRHFYDVIAATNERPSDSGVDGALFIAVCRGKVSEGLDFADNNARAVICVGIPFPNFKDIQVDLKKKYNDQRRVRDKTILTGSEWYEIQAFRALNQALGRCIRHRKDWGAILMVDDRYRRNARYLGGLSKWVRSGVVHHSNFGEMMESVGGFVEEMREMDRKDKEEEEKKKAFQVPTVEAVKAAKQAGPASRKQDSKGPKQARPVSTNRYRENEKASKHAGPWRYQNVNEEDASKASGDAEGPSKAATLAANLAKAQKALNAIVNKDAAKAREDATSKAQEPAKDGTSKQTTSEKAPRESVKIDPPSSNSKVGEEEEKQTSKRKSAQREERRGSIEAAFLKQEEGGRNGGAKKLDSVIIDKSEDDSVTSIPESDEEEEGNRKSLFAFQPCVIKEDDREKSKEKTELSPSSKGETKEKEANFSPEGKETRSKSPSENSPQNKPPSNYTPTLSKKSKVAVVKKKALPSAGKKKKPVIQYFSDDDDFVM